MPSLPELMPTQVSDETFGGVTYHIAGELVPVLSVDVTQMPVYFEHHILLWKNSTATIEFDERSFGLVVIVLADGTGKSDGRFADELSVDGCRDRRSEIE